MSTKQYKKQGMLPKTPKAPSHQRKFHGKSRRFRTGVKALAISGAALLVLGVIYFLNAASSPPAGTNQTGKYPFVIGDPGPGTSAPPIVLPSTGGGTFDLAVMRGKTVLLFFQEGLSCEPCWTQIRDIESNLGQFQALGIDTMVSITTDSLDALKQKVADEGISTPVLSDPNLEVSRTYSANQYGMMGESGDGHSFIVVGPDGRIKWRADYGGAPNYTMYVPISTLLADMKEGLKSRSL